MVEHSPVGVRVYVRFLIVFRIGTVTTGPCPLSLSLSQFTYLAANSLKVVHSNLRFLCVCLSVCQPKGTTDARTQKTGNVVDTERERESGGEGGAREEDSKAVSLFKITQFALKLLSQLRDFRLQASSTVSQGKRHR